MCRHSIIRFRTLSPEAASVEVSTRKEARMKTNKLSRWVILGLAGVEAVFLMLYVLHTLGRG